MTVYWVELLSKNGDDVEKLGITEYGLGSTFPNYAEFWGKYIRSTDYPHFEVTFRYHYSIFYHLVTALDQISRVNDFPLLDIGSPFTHLATVIDLTHRLFVTVLLMKGDSSTKKLEKDEFDAVMQKYWSDEYDNDFIEFENGYGRPVWIQLHDTEKIFMEHIYRKRKKDLKDFQLVTQHIRQYRNKLVHDRSPLKLFESGKLLIPKPDKLNKYRDASWAFQPIRAEVVGDYILAETLLNDLADKLLASLNKLWVVLLDLMPKSAIQGDNEELLSRLAESSMFLLNAQGYASGVVVSDNKESTEALEQQFPGILDRKESIPWLRPSFRLPDDSDADDKNSGKE